MNFRSEGPIQLGYSTIYVLPVAPGSFASPQKSLFNFRTVAIYAFPQTSNSASATAQRRTCTGYWWGEYTAQRRSQVTQGYPLSTRKKYKFTYTSTAYYVYIYAYGLATRPKQFGESYTARLARKTWTIVEAGTNVHKTKIQQVYNQPLINRDVLLCTHVIIHVPLPPKWDINIITILSSRTMLDRKPKLLYWMTILFPWFGDIFLFLLTITIA